MVIETIYVLPITIVNLFHTLRLKFQKESEIEKHKVKIS